MSTVFDNIATYLETVPERVRYLLVAVFGLILISGLFQLSELRAEHTSRRAAMMTELNEMSGPAQAIDWQERAVEANHAKEAWLEKRWSASTPGIASANAQAALLQFALEAGLESVRHSVSSDPVSIDGNELLRFELAGIGTPDSFASILVTLSTSPKTILVTEFSAPIRNNQKTRLYVAGYVPFVQTFDTEVAP